MAAAPAAEPPALAAGQAPAPASLVPASPVPAGISPASPAPASPAPAGPAPAGPAPAAAPAATAPTPGGRVHIQLGALNSEEAARGEWAKLSGRLPELLGGRRPAITRLEREGQPTLWRLRAGGFADAAAGRAACEQVRSRGGACSVIP
nr:SPOR domain-containing protein [Roseomonas acroporae]